MDRTFYQEIDTHGHAAIVVATYTKYVVSFDAGPWTNFANEPLLAASFCILRGYELRCSLAY